jgi:hypothetical protein
VHKVEGDATSCTELITLQGIGEHSGTALSDVYEFEFFTTPIAIFHLDAEERTSMNARLADVGAAAERMKHGGYGGHNSMDEFGIFRTLLSLSPSRSLSLSLC